MTLIDVLSGKEDGFGNAGRIALIARCLQNRRIECAVERVGRKTVVVVLTEGDGWETIGSSVPEHEWKFDMLVGTRWALEDAVGKLSNGRIVQWLRPAESADSAGECLQETPRERDRL